MVRNKNVTSAMLALILAFPAPLLAQKQVERPPQFVMFAFDGSYTLDVWKNSRNFTQLKKQNGVDAHFTFFLNPVYLLTRATSQYYDAPGGRKGSAIGWGDSVEDVSLRVDQLNQAYLEGHEIGSHAIGHWDGSGWSESDWDSEFSQFNHILDNLFSINGIQQTSEGFSNLLFNKDIIGFRAPQLGVSEGLWPTLAKYGFKYDTSKTSKEQYWPRKAANGLWNFPLARIQEPGGARTWLSMDYNFCVRDSARILSEDSKVMKRTAVDPKTGKTLKNNDKLCLRVITDKQKKEVKDNMLSIYRAYFNRSYHGNRAPLHIGHHFSPWMSGAYLEAFFEFADEVCGKPEVRCGVYKDLTNFMESRSAAQVQAYQDGEFAKLPRPKDLISLRPWDLTMQTSLDEQSDRLKVSLTGVDAARKGLVLKVSNLNQVVTSKGLALKDIRSTAKIGESVVVRFAVYDRLGQEVATASYDLKSVGTKNEAFDGRNIEDKWLAGHMEGAHADEALDSQLDFSKGR